MVFVESETEVTFCTKNKIGYGGILMMSECFTEFSYARRLSDGLLIEFNEDGTFKSATLNDEEKTREWMDEHNEKDYWDICLRGIVQ